MELKLIYNRGESTGSLINKLENEYLSLQELESKPHINISNLITYFVRQPPGEMLKVLPKDIIDNYLKEPNYETNNTRTKSSLISVVEHIPNNLEDFLTKDYNSLSIKRLLSICKGIGEGLNHLLKQKIVHRNIKLKNIRIDEEECPVICDFGLAVKLDDNFTYRLSNLDKPGGDESHLSPEVLNSYKKQKRKKDILLDYSKQPSFEFGVICYEILNGLTHPLGDYPLQLEDSIQFEFDRTKIDSKENIPIEVRDTITNLLKYDQNERPRIEEILHLF